MAPLQEHSLKDTAKGRAAAFFVQQLKVLDQKARHFSGYDLDDIDWHIVLRLILARLNGLGLTAVQLGERIDSIDSRLTRLLDRQIIESFYDPAQSDQPIFGLSGEAARRMIELFRATAHRPEAA